MTASIKLPPGITINVGTIHGFQGDECDIILAVGRRYRRSDYIPVISWGLQARETAEQPVGTKLLVRGRLQSRAYTKVIDGESFQRMAFEVSAADAFFL